MTPNRMEAEIKKELMNIADQVIFIVDHSRENLPDEDPLIVAGNHQGILEVLLMIAFGPKRLERFPGDS